VSGGCLCKAHSFTIEACKIRFGFASCHCSLCRQSHSAPFVMWAGMNADCSTPDIFQVFSEEGAAPLTGFRSSPNCTRYFCPVCGTHLFIRYDDATQCNEKWAGEVHFPTAIVSRETFPNLEAAIKLAGRPRYLQVFVSDQHPAMGDLQEWVNAPKYGGVTGLEPL
jgi:hypothetical protein